MINANPELNVHRFELVKDDFRLRLPLNGYAIEHQSGVVEESMKMSVKEIGNSESLNAKKVGTTMQFIHTPGHTPGSQCILLNSMRLFTGGTS